MKRCGFVISLLLSSSLFFTGCGGSSDGGEGNTDTTAPVISLNGANPQAVEAGTSYVELGATANDDVDGDISGAIVIDTSAVNTSAVGNYNVTYNVSDAAGNDATEVNRTVNVADTIAPVITLEGASPQEIVVNTPYVEWNATANDSFDGDISADIVIDASAVDVNTTGDYNVTYNVSDTAGNPATTVTRTVTVILVDNTAPVITLIGPNPQQVLVDNPYVEWNATAIDNVDGDISANIIIDSSAVNTSVEGNYTVTYDVDDSEGNPAATVTRTVSVVQVIQPPTGEITGTGLACDTVTVLSEVDPADYNASATLKRNVSGKSDALVDNRVNPTGSNTMKRLSAVVPAMSSNGELVADADATHPLLISYKQQIVGDYETGDGSADIADPTNLDGVFVGLSLDNGETWKNFTISDSTDKTSMDVTWAGSTLAYPGHAQKPTMGVHGNNILVAWNDKYCPSRNPLDLPQEENGTAFYTDYFDMVGAQGSIDYTEDDGTVMVAPNGKEVYEVPFSCVWTARGIFDPGTGIVTWHSPMQLTSGMRDSNHINIAASEAGFAIAWQEDTEGLRSGKGAGPGEGWSGATTNHGTDIWYTSMKEIDFADAIGIDENDTTKLKSLNNFHYPVRITDNDNCNDNDNKLYCQYMCDTYGDSNLTTANNKDDNITRCLTYDTDMLTDTQVVLDGDTGASRPALNILKTDMDEYVVVFGYEETKGLSESNTGGGGGDQDQGTVDTNISVEGKSVYFESFLFSAIDNFDEENITATMQTVAMPLVSAGNIVNIKVPDQNTSEMIYENARRLVIGTQVDSCDADMFNFVFMYKQSFDTQGASSDMFIRVNNGFTYDSFIALNDGATDHIVTNISAQNNQIDINASTYTPDWDINNLDDNTYENSVENTFSPRIFLRGNDIYTGFEYSPDETKTAQEHMPVNFHVHTYLDGAWTGPQNITMVTKSSEITLDPRFFTTPKGADTGLESDKSNPDVLFLTWGNHDYIDDQNKPLGKAEADLFYTRSTDKGVTWEPIQKLAAKEGATIMEKEVNSFASADGRSIYNVWIQEEEHDSYDPNDPFSGLDTWFGRVDYNISIAP